jgi:TetR/AcrR family transcriptional regulator, transcriptional repressor for nem operon
MSRSEQKLQTRQRIIEAAGRVFRRGGYGGAGVDGLAKEAGVTSGAFYVHFPSKADAFRESVSQSIEDVSQAIQAFQEQYGKDWWSEFVRFYLGPKRQCGLHESCGLQSLSAEVARADESVKSAYEDGIQRLASLIVRGPESVDAPRDENGATMALAALIGAVTMARAVGSQAQADQIASSAERLLLPASRTKGVSARRETKRR